MRTLRGRIFTVVMLLTTVAIFLCWFILRDVLREKLVEEAERELAREAVALQTVIDLRGLENFGLEMERWREVLGARLTLIDMSGRVLQDSDADPRDMDNHRGRPEVVEALREGAGSSLRYSRSLGMHLLYVARKFEVDGRGVVLRIAYPLSVLKGASEDAFRRGLPYLIVLVVIALILEFWLVRRFFSPLDRIVESASAIAAGEETSFPILRERELMELSSALDFMSEKLRGALRELDEEREELATIVASLPVGLVLLDGDRRIRYSNDRAGELLRPGGGISVGETVERALPIGDLHAMLDGEEASRCLLLDLPERGRRHLSLCRKSLPAGILLIVTDLTEQRRLEEAKRNFVADAGHEFQTPLTAIRLTTEYLLEEDLDGKGRRRYLRSILEQQERISGLVDDLLLLSRVESGVPREDLEEVDLVSLVGAVAAESRLHPLAGEVEVRCRLPEAAPLSARYEEIARAVRNVVENAVKYVRGKFGGDPGGRIDIDLEEGEEGWILRISDNGIGIAPGSEEEIFSRFRRGDASRTRSGWGEGGYGLGLAISKRIIEAHGGSIRLLSGGDGATFEIVLPFA